MSGIAHSPRCAGRLVECRRDRRALAAPAAATARRTLGRWAPSDPQSSMPKSRPEPQADSDPACRAAGAGVCWRRRARVMAQTPPPAAHRNSRQPAPRVPPEVLSQLSTMTTLAGGGREGAAAASASSRKSSAACAPRSRRCSTTPRRSPRRCGRSLPPSNRRSRSSARRPPRTRPPKRRRSPPSARGLPRLASAYDGAIKSSELTWVRARQLIERITVLRHSLFTKNLLERLPSPLLPGIWRDIVLESPAVRHRVSAWADDWCILGEPEERPAVACCLAARCCSISLLKFVPCERSDRRAVRAEPPPPTFFERRHRCPGSPRCARCPRSPPTVLDLRRPRRAGAALQSLGPGRGRRS